MEVIEIIMYNMCIIYREREASWVSCRHRSYKWLLATFLPGCHHLSPIPSSTSAQGAVLRRLRLFAGKFVHLMEGKKKRTLLTGFGRCWVQENAGSYGIIMDNLLHLLVDLG